MVTHCEPHDWPLQINVKHCKPWCSITITCHHSEPSMTTASTNIGRYKTTSVSIQHWFLFLSLHWPQCIAPMSSPLWTPPFQTTSSTTLNDQHEKAEWFALQTPNPNSSAVASSVDRTLTVIADRILQPQRPCHCRTWLSDFDTGAVENLKQS